MGQHLSGMMGPSDPSLNVTIDFENAPNPASDEATAVVARVTAAMTALQDYQPKPAPIRDAISKPHDHAIAVAAVVALIPNVDTIAEWHALSGVVAGQIGTTCEHIVQNTPRATQGGTTVGDLPADSAALAKMLHFCWKFDQGKMMQPGIQNDFAGYRRVVGKVTSAEVPSMVVDEAATGNISMWVADMAPFTGKAVGNVRTAERKAVLAALANCCAGMAGRAGGAASGGGFGAAAASAVVPVGSMQWLIEVMVACLVFYDRACEGGANVFEAREVQIKKCISVVKKFGGPGVDALCNSLKYSTLHYNDAPAAIQRVLE